MDRLINQPGQYDPDTIAAVSTPPGEGGIGVIRLSGPDAISIAVRLFRRKDGSPLAHPRASRQYYGHIVAPATGDVLDEVLLSVMPSPKSYTREDVVEICGHGGQVPMRSLLSLVCSHGARLAEPGEFTKRAFLNGRIDLTQAEAVLDTIRSRTDAGLRAAQRHLSGEIGRRVSSFRARLINLLATVEAAIDFADEDLTFLAPAQLLEEISSIKQEIEQLIASQRQGKLYREGALLAIIGRPNTGKSSLLNRLLGETRAIVTDIPGTTRDVIEEQFDLGGIPVRLVDTAGIRHTEDVIERMGVERSRASIQQADLILLVIDRAVPLTSEDEALLREISDRQAIIIANKADLPSQVGDIDAIAVSAKTGDGIAHLLELIRQKLLGDAFSYESPALASDRQREAAERAADALRNVLETIDCGGSEELIAVDLMGAANALGEISGDSVRDDVINEIFARFCIGK